MGYVVVVLAIINSAALVWLALIVLALTQDLPANVETAVQDEIRKQDDRIEKRVAKVQGARGNDEGAPPVQPDGRIEVGRPLRR